MDVYKIVISSLLCDAILNYKISAHLHNLFMDFPQFKVPNGASYFLQLHVSDTLLSATAILETGLIFCNDKS